MSNLNRQFLFRRKHVRQPKSTVALESVKHLRKDLNIKAYHDNVTDSKFGPDFISQFTIVVNALDNLDARRHVNRVCLASKVPLVESGTAGFKGQVQPILGGTTECFECVPKSTPKQYPYCTIHATPSQPIHCVIWAKEALFPSLFGEENKEEKEEVDETALAAQQQTLPKEVEQKGAKEAGISQGRAEFFKCFTENIYRLLQLEALWEKRKKPRMLDFEETQKNPDFQTCNESNNDEAVQTSDQVLWSVAKSAKVFVDCCNELSNERKKVKALFFDKDDELALNFVTAAANLRSYCYGIEMLSKFKVKEMAGNIIPAIASTNAIIAGIIVLEAIKVICGRFEDIRFTYLYKEPNHRGDFLRPVKVEAKNQECYICKEGNKYVFLEANPKTLTLGELKNEVVMKKFSMVSPTFCYKTSLIYESPYEDEEEEEGMKAQLAKTLEDFGILNNCILEITDDRTTLQFSLILKEKEKVTELGEDEVEKEVKWKVLDPSKHEGVEPVQKKIKN